jgi:hypothetical protein
LCYGNLSKKYSLEIDACANLSYTVTGLSKPPAWYFTVTADTLDTESGFLQELVCDFIKVATHSNGQIGPGGSNTLPGGSPQPFLIVPNAGYPILPSLDRPPI